MYFIVMLFFFFLFFLHVEIPQYLMESGWANQGKQIACTQVRLH